MKYIANLLLAVHTVAAAEAMALARRSGLDLRARPADPGQLHRQLGDLAPARPADGRTRLVSRPGPDQHAAPDPGADRGARRQARACPPRCSPRPRRSSTRPWPTAGATWTSPACTIRSGVSALENRMTWSLASYTAHGAQGFGVLREDGALVAPADLKRWPSPLELLEDWPAAEAVLRDLDVDNAPVDRVRRAAPAAAVAAQGDLRRRQLPQAHARDGRRDPGGGLAPVLLPQGPHHLGHRPQGPDRDQLGRPGPGTTGRPSWPWSSGSRARTLIPNGPGFTPPPTASATTSRRAATTGVTPSRRTRSATTGSRPSPSRARCRSARA